MVYVSLYDRDSRFLFLSSVHPGLGVPASALIGTYPWDWVQPEDREFHRAQHKRLHQTKNVVRYGVFWEFRHSRIYCHNVLTWLGLGDVAAMGVTHEFPAELDLLTAREKQVLQMFANLAVDFVADQLEISPRTVRDTLGRCQYKLELQNLREVQEFAVRFDEALGGNSN